MHPVVVNGIIAMTGIASAVACVFVRDDQVSVALGGYATFILGYVIKRFGDESYRPKIERDAP